MEQNAEQRAIDGVDVRAAATIAILRDSGSGLQVLLTTRPKELRFMGGAVVFPGGAVAAADEDPAWQRLSRLSPHDASTALGVDEAVALSFYVAALRESFEEVGYPLADDPLDPAWRAASPDELLAICAREHLTLATDRLVPAGRWITPLGSPIRFDARFFVAPAPDGWTPQPDPHEVASCWWATPAEALAQLGAGELLMAPPTIEMLQRLDGLRSVADALADLSVSEGIGNEKILSTRLSPFVQLVLAPNPGIMTGPGTNTYVVGSGPAFVIDPAVDDDDYLAVVQSLAGDIGEILITHRHPDHVGGVAALATATGARVRAFGSAPAGGHPVTPLVDGEELRTGSLRLGAVHTPGHATDHVCFHAPDLASLFAGDNILGEGTAVIAPPDGNMGDYLQSLRRLRDLPVDRIYPGHFKPLTGGAEVVDGYIEHRLQREQKILAAVAAGASTIEAVVASAYDDTPLHLHPVAALSALAHLEKLATDGKVVRQDDDWATGDV
ncbi:MAG TPA: MBL fold metallo-hydrolase [Actinomycetota bacterium]|nr:MBL fold metallo-hydrolase [Actinomycetota bacterium]